MVPLGIQIRNYVEVRPSLASQNRELALRLLAVSGKVEILTARMRETRPAVEDFLVPMDPREDGLPLNPYARLLGQIEAIGETTNPVSNTALWRLQVDVSGFPLEVLVRKEPCTALPTEGSHVGGNLWLAADIVPGQAARPDYIR